MKLKISELDSCFHNRLFEISTEDLVDRGTKFKEKTIKTVLTLKKDANYYSLQGNINTVLEYICARCLDKNPVQLIIPIDILLCDKNNNGFSKNGNDIIYFNKLDEYLNLNKVFADLIELAKPIKPLCNPDCKGLCPICGINKKFSCSCIKEKINTDWDKLKELQIK